MRCSSLEDAGNSSPHGYTEWSSPARHSADQKRLSGLSMSEKGGPLKSSAAGPLVAMRGDQRPKRGMPESGRSCIPSQGKPASSPALQSLCTCCGSEEGGEFQRCLCPFRAGDTSRRKRNAGTDQADCAEHGRHSPGPRGLYSEKERAIQADS